MYGALHVRERHSVRLGAEFPLAGERRDAGLLFGRMILSMRADGGACVGAFGVDA